MRLRRQSFQIVMTLMTLMATERFSAAEQSAPHTFDPPKSEYEMLPHEDRVSIAKAVATGVSTLTDLVTDENASLLGFKSHEEVVAVKIGEPLRVYQVNLADLRRFDPSSSRVTGPSGLLKLTGNFIFPLQTSRLEDQGGALKTRSTILVSQRKDKIDTNKKHWKPTGWGLTPLGKAISEHTASVKEFVPGFVVWVPALNLHFLGDLLSEDLILIPLATRQTYGLTKGIPISAKIVFALYAREAKSLDERAPG